ncbi:hypothetical protein [Blastococcus capsensis]|uniref:hypothetical protein n=1 Tax=Blastococcus capsensis TaxID=1564163 RepID=UPI0025410826|nr:hypothetical protein [Blastococcus capsensis]MDK3256531.1 hypothetical protein [Blastococcus capsensis]
MSMSSPFEPHLGRPDDGIPAADPGPGAPPPAEGYGPAGEEPDRPAEATRPPAEGGDAQTDPPEEPPFRTPDPHDIGPASEN